MIKTMPMDLLLYGSSSCVFVFSFDVVQTKPANIKDTRGPTINERTRAQALSLISSDAQH
ncbi:hypothetical protein NC652_021986 [Populus alba x Populus x berolinensis]|nr:hypothetical protein NC652_021986 [Populus alba x Populus x berolinensis]